MHAVVLAAVIAVVAQVNGTVADIRVHPGDDVAAGDVVVAFDTTWADRQVDAANAEVAAAEEARDTAQRQLDAFARVDAAIANGTVEAATLAVEGELRQALAELDRMRAAQETGDDYDHTVDAVRAAQAAVDEAHWRGVHRNDAAQRATRLRASVAAAAKRGERAAAAVTRANAALEATRVQATAAGTVHAVLVTEGQRVRAGQPVLRVDTTDP
jgi:multidrug resistance efflux pump